MAKKTITKNNIDEQILALADKITGIKSVNQYPYLVERIVNIKSEIQNKEFRLTVVGEFSSGKSTFLNALIGRDILPHAVSETTATITYIHNVPKRDKMENKAVVHFNEDRADETLDILSEKQKFQDYLSALNKNGDNIVKLVRAVDVYVNFSEITDPIVIVDTPGLNGVADGHRDVTMREISRSHASICLFHLRGIAETDVSFIRELQKYQSNFFFVLNHIDELKRDEENVEERIEDFRSEVSSAIYDGKAVPKYIYGISGLKALVSRDRNIDYLFSQDKLDDKAPLTTDEKKSLYEESRLEILENDLFNYLESGDKSKQFYGSIFQQLESILNDVYDSNKRLKDIYEADKEDIPEKKLLEEELSTLEELTAKNKYTLKNNIGAEIDNLTRELKSQQNTACTNQIEVFKSKFEGLNDVESIKRFNDKNTLGNDATVFYASQKALLEHAINNRCSEIYKAQVEEVNKTMSRFSFEKKDLKVQCKVSLDNESYKHVADRVQQKKDDIASLNQRITQNAASLKKNQRDLSNEQSNLSDLRSKKSMAMQNEVPKYETWTDKVCVGSHVERNTFVSIITFGLAGKKTVLDYEYVTKNNQNEINEKRNEIESRYRPQISQLQCTIEDLQKAVDRDADMAQYLRGSLVRAQEALRSAEVQRERDIQASKETWIDNQKKKMREQISKWFENGGEVYEALLEGITTNMPKCKKELQGMIDEYYDAKLTNYKEQINAMITRLTTEGKIGETIKQLSVIDSDIKTIEGCKVEINNLKKQL